MGNKIDNNKINIRKVRKEDLMDVSELVVNSWKTSYRGIINDDYLESISAEETYQKRLKDYTKDSFIVAEIDDEIVGFARYREGNYYENEYPNIDCELYALYVKTEYKRNGIGKKLVSTVINEFKDKGYSNMVIWCLKYNYPSRAFYEKMRGKYIGENTIERGNREYKEVGFVYSLKQIPKDELELVVPTKEHKREVEEYLQEFIDNNEYEIAGDGGLDRLKDFDKWLIKINNDLSIETVEKGRIPASLYLTVRKYDRKIVGNVQIRHFLNEFLLNNDGHIGDSIRPSERRKGYATEQIRLALEKCKELGIDNVLMGCDKYNIGSAKSIKYNGGVLENEVNHDGIIKQRYWINLKKRFAVNPNNINYVKDGNIKTKSVNSKEFNGDIVLVTIDKVYNPYIIEGINLCIANDNYKWLEFFDYSKKYRLNAMYDDKNEIIEWYFDIARKVGKEKGVPYEDDIYLDVVMDKKGKVRLLDEDELKRAYERLEVNKQDYDMAVNEAKQLMEQLQGKKEELQKFTDNYLNEMLKEN